MSKCRVYTKERLERNNAVYLSEYSHRIEKSDIQFANRCVKMMYNALCFNRPKVGDIIQYTTQDGEYYPHAHIDRIENGMVSVCLNPFVPFIFIRDGEIEMESVSGGPWVQVPESALQKTGTESKWFCFFGSSGVCAHGSIEFEGYANCWEFKEENPLFGEYSTKLYDRTIFRKGVDGKWFVSGSTIFGLPDKADFEQWKRELKAVQFGDFGKDDTVTIFSYKEQHFLVPVSKWKRLSYPQSKRRINGRNYVCVKLHTDDNAKVVSVYRYANT